MISSVLEMIASSSGVSMDSLTMNRMSFSYSMTSPARFNMIGMENTDLYGIPRLASHDTMNPFLLQLVSMIAFWKRGC